MSAPSLNRAASEEAATPFTLLEGIRVVDLSSEIAGPYATKLLADAGADVVKVESPEGDPLRSWVASGTPHPADDGALFQYLNAGKRAIVAEIGGAELERLLGAADLVVDDGRLDEFGLAEVRRSHPHLVVVSVTLFGTSGPWSRRPATEFTLQAECGSIVGRGPIETPPLAAGGRPGEWITGAYAAVGGLAAVREARRCGTGDHVDVSVFDAMCNTMTTVGPLSITMNPGPRPFPRRTVETPSIEPTADGFVGFCTVTSQQFHDFLAMIGRPDIADDPELATFGGRRRGRKDFVQAVREWTTKHTTAEIVEMATLFRVPVAPLGTPETITKIDHFAARGIYAPNPSGLFLQPRTPYMVDGASARPLTRAPRIAENGGSIDWGERGADRQSSARELPFHDLRIIDLTSFWAGPFSTHMMALLGADVMHVESVQHPDGMRFTFTGNLPSISRWWESSSGFQGWNTNKRGITLDLTRKEGRELLFDLIRRSDALVENYSPRVLDNFGITWHDVHEANPSLVMLRMPAYGLDGPWRERTAFAQTIEQASGMAWLTGFPDGPPMIPRGPCDPIAGLHGAFALLSAVMDRDRTGQGHFIEAPMIESALNAAAEMVIEHSTYGSSLYRAGNRGPVAAPQGVYACRGEEQWVALAVVTDEQWESLRRVLGDPDWAGAQELARAEGRRRHHDLLDEHLGRWFADRQVEDVVEVLTEAGVPAGRVIDPIELLDNVQLRARGAIEAIDSPVVGRPELVGLPFRFASNKRPWIRRAAPTLGQDNREVLERVLGLNDEDISALEQEAVIGTEPLGLVDLKRPGS